ncbi:MAG: valine--tRNA ligase, partial [Ruminococcaceae bacterium]|nr:valine--tRNA ligase [Oscillospiraceae bacterium]
NGIDPLEIIDKFGADALRFMLATGNSPGNDMRFSDEKVQSSRNFANKIWNASRFILMNIDGHDVKNKLPDEFAMEDQWILDSFNRVTKEITDNLEHFELGIAVQKLYDFLWDEFCDRYIEIAKIRLNSEDEKTAQNVRQVLVWVMSGTLKLLHPFMPYITEEIWQTLPHDGEAIMVSKWPEFEEAHCFPQAADNMRSIMEAIRAVRNRRSEMNVPPSRKTHLFIATGSKKVFEDGVEIMKKLAYASEVDIGEEFELDGTVTIVTADAKLYIPMSELVDKKAELERLTKELESAQKQYANAQAKLTNEKFISKAPANVIEGVKQNAEKLSEHIALIQSSIEALK